MIKVGTDFSGIGSPEAALKRLGLPHHNIFACDIDKYAKKSYLANNDTNVFYDDITTRDFNEVPQLDLYVAGFPCQSFSTAGNRGGFEDTRGTLFFDVAKFINVNQPNCFILENVKGLLSHDKGKTYQTITDVLTNGGGTLNGQMGMDSIEDGLGYHVYTQVLNTKDYGIPQNRERIFIVGFKYWREFRFPKKMELKLRLKDMLQDNPNYFKLYDDYNSKLVNNNIMGTLTCNSGSASKRNGFKLIIEDSTIKVDDKYYLSDKMIEGFKQGSLGHNYKPKEGNRRTNNYISHSTHTRIRRLTPLECWRLQGFTDEEFYKAQKLNSDTQLYKQAGNSITVNVMTEILKKIYLK